MKRIKIISGTTFGHHNEQGRLEPKTRKSEPFEVSDEVAAYLVSEGHAEIVESSVATPDKAADVVEPGDRTVKEEVPAEGKKNALCEDEPVEYSESMKVSELRAIGKSVGITFPAVITKKEMVKRLDEFFGEIPDLAPEDPVG